MSEVSADDRDLAIRTMLGEEGSEVGQAGVAAVILNRLAAGSYGESIGDVIDAPGQFNGRPHKGTWQSTASRDDPRYVAAGQLFDAVRDGSLPDPTNGATHFYAPTAQARLALVDGRPVTPNWAQGRGLKLGSSMFYAPQGRVDRKPEEPGFKVDFSQIAKSPNRQIAKSPNQIAAEFPSDQLPPGATLFQPSGSKAASKAVEFPSDQLPPGATLFKPDAQKAAPGLSARVEEGADEFSDPITAEAYRKAHEPLHDRRYPSPPSLPGAFMGPPEESLAGVVLDPSLPIGVRGLAAASQEGLNFARAPFEMTQQQAQRIRQGNPLTPQDAGSVAMNAGMLGAREAPGGAAATRGLAPDAGVALLGQRAATRVAPDPGAASPTLRPSAGEIPPAPPKPPAEPREFPRDQLPPGAEPVKPPTEVRPGAPTFSGEAPTTIQFRGKTYSGATKLDAVTAAQRATGVSMDRIWDEGTNRPTLRIEPLQDSYAMDSGPGTSHFVFKNQHNQPVSYAIVGEEPGGKLYVYWVGRTREETQDNSADGANTLGPVMMRQMLRLVQQRFPDAKLILGDRVSGARAQSRVDGKPASIELPRASRVTLPPDIPTTVYRGSGRADPHSAYNQGMGPQSEPIAGPGRYYAFNKGDAQTFGPSVASLEMPVQNPLVIRDGNVWRELTRKAGWQTPNPFGTSEVQMREMTQRLQDVVRGMGHDGIVAYWDDASPYDIGPKGENLKLLRSTFGMPQVVKFEEEASRAPMRGEESVPHNEDEPIEEEPSPPIPRQPGGVGAAVTPPSALLPPAAPEPKISVIQPVRNFAHAIRAIFDAPGMSDEAKAAGGLIRESRGLSKRAAEQARSTLEPFMRQVRRLSVDGRFKLVDYIETRIEGGRAWFMKDTTLQPVADALREVLWRVRNTMEDMPSEARMGFVENYFPHQWVDQKKAGEFVRQWVARMGEGGFTKKRSIPTVLDGIRAGLVPRTVDPIEAVLLYIENAYQFIAHNRTFNEAKDAGYVKLATPGDQPEGWVRLNGRLADRGFVKAWAPEDFARVYNNALSTIPGPAADVIHGIRRAFNIITGIELAWPGFHMSAMAMESIANKIASALDDATRWRLDQTAIKLATAPAAPITIMRRGAEAQHIYRSLTDGSAEMREIVDLLARADFRFVGKGRAADEYRFSGADNYFKAIRRGTLLKELNTDLKRAGRQPIVGTAAVVLRNIGRAMETVTAPLFEYAIPKLKSGAAVELMANWLRAHPDATAEAKLAHAREIANVIDDRFGEMNHDNLFWHANLRAGAQMALLSFSWEMGFLRTVVGGSIDWAKFPFTHRQTERMGYLIALPLAIAAVNGASTYLHTGEAPSGMDFVAARTGGKNPDGSPERASIPSWARNVLAWANVLSGPKRGSLADELYGMANPGVKDAIDFARNSDWHGDPIFSSAPNAPPWLKQILQHIVEQHIPMPLQLGTQPKPGTGITDLERILGVRPAPFFLQEPDLYQSIYDKKNIKEWKAAQKFRERQRALHGQ